MTNVNTTFFLNAKNRTGAAFSAAHRGLDGLRKSSFAVAGGIAALAGTAGIGFAINQSLKFNDSLKKTSDKLGVAAGELVGLRLAAQQYSGFAAGTFDTALQRQTRRVNEAALGMGEAQGALRELGLDAKELARLRPDQQFHAIADAMSEIDDQGTKVRLAFKLFDTEGVALVNTLSAGSDGLRQMRQEAEALGLVLSSGDLARIEEFNSAFDRIGFATTGLANKITVAFAPVGTALSEAFIDFTKDAQKSKLLADSLATAFKGFGFAGIVALNSLGPSFQIVEGFLLKTKTSIQFLRNEFIDLLDSFDKIPKAAGAFVPGLDALRLLRNQVGDLEKTGTGLLLEQYFQAETLLGKGADGINSAIAAGDEFLLKVSEAQNNPAPGLNDNAAGAGGGQGLTPDQLKIEQAKAEALRNTLLDAETLETESHARRLEQLREFEEAGIVLKTGYRELEKAEEARHGEAIRAIRKAEIDKELDLEKRALDAKAKQKQAQIKQEQDIRNAQAQTISNLAGVFGNNKAFAIAEAIVNTHLGITKALASAPPPWNFALAASVALKGFAAVRSIRASSKGGGPTSSPSVGGGGGIGRNQPRGSTISQDTVRGASSQQLPPSFILNATFNGFVGNEAQLKRELTQFVEDGLRDGEGNGFIQTNETAA